MTHVDNDLDADQLKVIDRVEKLMRLAAKNPNAEEAASAAAKAQELLVAYNLSAELVGNTGSSADAKREKQKIQGGMYQYQRNLWHAVAKLNFCLHFVMQQRAERNRIRKTWDGGREKWVQVYYQHQHVLIGKRINARLTITMGQYLEQAIERLVRERYPLSTQRFLSEAIAFREGIADELYWRLLERRRRLEKDEEERRTRDAAAAGYSVSQALTIGSLTQQEEDANYDVMYGEGWSARQRQQRADRARVEAEADAAWTAWAEANPAEAAAEEAKRLKEARRYRPRGGGPGSRGGETGREKRQSSSEYWQGRKAGESLGIDQQTGDSRERTRALS